MTADESETPDEPDTPDEPETPGDPDDRNETDAPDEPVAPDAVGPRRRMHGTHASSALIGVLTLLLGFAIAVQVHANSGGDALSGLREDDLIGILDNQNARADRLRQQIGELQQNLDQLRNSGDRSAAARRQAAQQRTTLGILLGTLPATGPGIVATITDPSNALNGEALFAVIEELRGAGAESIQFGPVRVTTTTSITGDPGRVDIDGTALTAPYRVVAIGDSATLDTALNIPGGVAASVRTAGGNVDVAERSTVSISVTRTLAQPRYAKPTK